MTQAILAASPLVWTLEHVRIDGQPFSPYPYQATLLADRSSRQLVLKARQVGVTLAVAICEAHTAIFAPGSLCLIISRDQRAAADVLNRIYGIFDELDDPPALERRNALEAVLANGSRIVSQPATAKAGRGYTATSVVLDEFAFQEHDTTIYRAVLPTLSRGGRMTIISTPNGMDNLFYRLWHGEEGGDWSKRPVHWKDCPAFTDEWYERERGKYTEQAWASEYDLDFATSGDTVFKANDIDALEIGARGLQPPRPGRDYYSAWDIGRRHDATVGVVLDVTDLPAQLVGYRRELRLPYPRIQSLIEETAREYGGRLRVETTGIGDPVVENLTIYAERFSTTGASKVRIIERLLWAVERGLVKAKDVPQLVSELRSYRWDDSRLVQDSVIALALAVDAAWLRVQAGEGGWRETLPQQPASPGRMSPSTAPLTMVGGVQRASRWSGLPSRVARSRPGRAPWEFDL